MSEAIWLKTSADCERVHQSSHVDSIKLQIEVVNNPRLPSVWRCVDEFDQTQTSELWSKRENNLCEKPLDQVKPSQKKVSTGRSKLKATRKVLSNWNWPVIRSSGPRVTSSFWLQLSQPNKRFILFLSPSEKFLYTWCLFMIIEKVLKPKALNFIWQISFPPHRRVSNMLRLWDPHSMLV